MRVLRIAMGLMLAVSAGVAGQSRSAPAAPPHQHYERSSTPLQPGPDGRLAPRLQNLGVHTFKVTTTSPRAQQFINQGVNLVYGFNHTEAGRAFAEAARLDPSCAMAYWGQALVLGPNINATMNPEDEGRARELVQKAAALGKAATVRERDYIAALSARYTGNPADRQKADKAFADAMRALAKKHPGDLDAATMFAESLMNLRPWNYWTRDGVPLDGTAEAVASLTRVLAAHANHPGALHYWIHLWEPTMTPERAEKEADRLLPLMPGAGHMVHMPAHIYLRVGRFADVVTSNQRAVAADEAYITQCRAQGMYPLAYYPHNIHFVWLGATMSGQSALAIDAATKTASAVAKATPDQRPFVQGFLAVPFFAHVRFGRWDDLLTAPKPHFDSLYMRGVWHFARGSALAGKGRLAEADQELAELQKVAGDPELAKVASFAINSPQAILRIAPEVLAGDIASRRQEYDRAIAFFERAIRHEDALIYNEPPDWHAPVRHWLGAVLLEAGRPAEAEVVYWEDLRRNRENGWALFGLQQALERQGKADEAALARERFAKAWSRADLTLTSSRF